MYFSFVRCSSTWCAKSKDGKSKRKRSLTKLIRKLKKENASFFEKGERQEGNKQKLWTWLFPLIMEKKNADLDVHYYYYYTIILTDTCARFECAWRRPLWPCSLLFFLIQRLVMKDLSMKMSLSPDKWLMIFLYIILVA